MSISSGSRPAASAAAAIRSLAIRIAGIDSAGRAR